MPAEALTRRARHGKTNGMKGRRSRFLALAAVALAGMLSACASNEPFTAPQAQPQTRLPRAPVVAPSGYTSPWWWPMPSSWWPWQ